MIRNVGSPVARVVGKRVFRPGYPTPEVSDISLQAVEASTVFDLDATIAESYPGEGSVWKNLVAAPADGADQDDYDFTMTGPLTFDEDKFTFNGEDYFQVAANTDLINAWHKTTGGEDWWKVVVFNHPANTSPGNVIMFSTQPAAFTNGDVGISLNLGGSSSNHIGFMRQRGETGGISGSVMSANGGPHLLIISKSHATNTLRHWQNTVTGTDTSNTYNATTNNASGLFTLGALSGGDNPLSSNYDVLSFAGGKGFLDDEKAAAIIAALEERHNRSYS